MAQCFVHLVYDECLRFRSYTFPDDFSPGHAHGCQFPTYLRHNSGVAQAQNRIEGFPQNQAGGQHPLHCQGAGGGNPGGLEPNPLMQQASHDAGMNGANEAQPAGSDPERISPDSWSSGSRGEESFPQAITDILTKNVCDGRKGPDFGPAVPSFRMEELKPEIAVNEVLSNIKEPELPTVSKQPSLPKARMHKSFSERQMNVLVQEFKVHRYLPPAQMKNLAEITGLTYKQVKNWFQNRRMKLRRHQKDTGWMSERYVANRRKLAGGFLPTRTQPSFRRDAHPLLQEIYHQHMMRASFQIAASNDLASHDVKGPGVHGAHAIYPTGPGVHGVPDFYPTGPGVHGVPDFYPTGPGVHGVPDFYPTGPVVHGVPDFYPTGPGVHGVPDFYPTGPSVHGVPDFYPTGPGVHGVPDFYPTGPSVHGGPASSPVGPNVHGVPVGYTTWSPGTHQSAVPQANGWPADPGINHCEFSTTDFSSAGTPAHELGFDQGFDLEAGMT